MLGGYVCTQSNLWAPDSTEDGYLVLKWIMMAQSTLAKKKILRKGKLQITQSLVPLLFGFSFFIGPGLL